MLSEPTLNETIREKMKQFILSERLQPGDKLPSEEALGARLHVSRSAMREALRSMEALGMVEARQGSGRVVRDFNFNSIIDNLSYGLAFHNRSIFEITAVRKALESHFICDTVRQISDAEITVLGEIVERIRGRVLAGQDYRDEDYAFHSMLVLHARNTLVMQLFEISWQMKYRALGGADAEFAPSMREIEIHEDIYRAIARRDPVAAQQAVLAHFSDSEDRLQRRMLQEDASAA